MSVHGGKADLTVTSADVRVWPVADISVDGDQVRLSRGLSRSTGRTRLRADGHRSLQNLAGVGVAALILVEMGQVLQHIREIRMIRTERVPEGRHRLLV